MFSAESHRPPGGGGVGGTKASVSGPGRLQKHRLNKCQRALLGIRYHKSGFPACLERDDLQNVKRGAEGVTLIDLHKVCFSWVQLRLLVSLEVLRQAGKKKKAAGQTIATHSLAWRRCDRT